MAIGMEYVKSGMGILKMIEILLTFIVVICVIVSKEGFQSDFKERQQDYNRYDSLAAFNILGFIVASLVFSVYSFKLYDYYPIIIPRFACKFLNLILVFPLSIGCLISGFLMIAQVKHDYDSFLYKTNQGKWISYTKCAAVAVVINFLVFVLFTVDIIVLLLEIRKIRNEEFEEAGRRRRRRRTP